MDVKYYLLLIAIFYINGTALGDPSYSIIAPKTVKFGDEFSALLSVFDITKDVIVNISTQNLDQTLNKGLVLTSKDAHQKVKIYITKDDTLNINKDFKILITLSGGINIKEELRTRLIFNEPIILVQSDRARYIPGQKVMFRVVLLDKNLKKFKFQEDEEINIAILDNENNKLKDFPKGSNDGVQDSDDDPDSDILNNDYLSDGVTNKLVYNLDKNAPIGMWKIVVTFNKQSTIYKFFVDYYKFPIANLIVNSPDIVYSTDPFLNYTVDFFYFFGKRAKALVDIKLKAIECSGRIIGQNDYLYEKKIEIIKESIPDSIMLDKFVGNCKTMTFQLLMNAMESITKDEYRTFAQFQYVKNDVKVYFNSLTDEFRSGKVITEFITLDGHQMANNKLMCIVTSQNEQGKVYPLYSFSKSKYFCQFETKTSDNQINIDIKDSFNKIIATKQLKSTPKCSEEFIQLWTNMLKEKYSLNEKIIFNIKSNIKLEEVIYIIFSRGVIVEYKVLKYEENLPITIVLTNQLIPISRISVYSKISGKQLFLSDSYVLKNNIKFPNNLEMKANLDHTTPGGDVKFHFQTRKGSEIYFLGRDKSTIGILDENDIYPKRILENSVYKKYIMDDEHAMYTKMDINFITSLKTECPSNYFMEFSETETNIEVRNNFDEAWLFGHVSFGRYWSVPHPAPRSLSSFYLSAFSMHDEYGIGFAEVPINVTVSKDFFLKLYVPAYIKANETSKINVALFNYYNDKIEANLDIFLEDSPEESCLSLKNIILEIGEIKEYNCMLPNFKDYGEYKITGKVNYLYNNKKFTDGETKSLYVKPNGYPENDFDTFYFDLTQDKNDKSINFEIPITWPENYIKGSEIILLSATKDLIPVIWEDRIKKVLEITKDVKFSFDNPGGCCQQRLVRYFPKVYWLDYMNNTISGSDAKNQDTANALNDLKFISENFCRMNKASGSFSAFDSDFRKEKSIPFVWQTILSLKMMKVLQKYYPNSINIDYITKSSYWINSLIRNGQIEEIDKDHIIYQTPTNAYLTAFAQIALEDKNVEIINYLDSIFESLQNPLDIFSTCYVLTLFKSSQNDACFKKIMNLAHNAGDEMYWIGSDNNFDYHVTAYGLMILNARGSLNEAEMVFKHLSRSQSFLGIFKVLNIYGHTNSELSMAYNQIISTEAMTDFVKFMKSYDINREDIFINVKSDVGEIKTFKFNSKSDLFYITQLNSNTRKLNIAVSGYGRLKLSVMKQYNMEISNGNVFNLKVDKKSLERFHNFTICSSLKNYVSVNNVIVEFDLPSGFHYKSQSVANDPNIDLIESTDSDTHITVYIKKVDKRDFCFSIETVEAFEVMNRQDFPVKIYNYYNKASMSITNFEI